MLKGKTFTLRPVLESDLPTLYAYHTDIDIRGQFYPRGVLSQVAYTHEFHEKGFWSRDDGMLVIVDEDGAIIGHIEFFKTVNYLDEYELGYLLYRPELRGKGIMSEAVQLFVRYLFESKNINRIRLIIHPGNAASRHVAEASGFTHEGTARGAWYHAGKHHDVEIYAILHDEVIT